MIANRMRITTDAFLGEIFTFTAPTTRVPMMLRNLSRSRWFLLLAIAGSAVLAILIIKLIALLAAAFDISFLRDVGNNVTQPPGGGWWENNPPPLGLIYISALKGSWLHQDPSMDSPSSIRYEPHGARLIYDTIETIRGQDWYHISSVNDRTPGWIPASDLSSTRPPPMPPNPVKLSDLGLEDAHPSVAMVCAGNG